MLEYYSTQCCQADWLKIIKQKKNRNLNILKEVLTNRTPRHSEEYVHLFKAHRGIEVLSAIFSQERY